ncbi:putative membrane protein [Kalaharituber pfeilii]|nr:putative membrane protein [Kalaharituber pfeilii]
MQRSGFPAPATSPPLHHPVPQHVSSIPMMRSPPPPPSSAAGYSSYGSQSAVPQPGTTPIHPGYGGFFNDHTAQMGFQVGRTAYMAGQEYVEQNLFKYINVTALKHYFNVTNGYVLNKLGLVLFPWRHKPWSRMGGQRTGANGQVETYFLPPRDDINSPDMYIPVMAFVTYILLSTLLAGLAGNFKPDLLGRTATTAFVIVIFEILGLKLGCYLLNISNESQLLDLVAYSGYKFVGIIVNMTVSRLNSSVIMWIVFLYTFASLAFFLLRSLKYVLLPDNITDNPRGTTYAMARSQKLRRTQFLFFYSYVVQFLFMWILSSNPGGSSGTTGGK